VSVFAAVFTLPATAGDYPESWQWWQGQIAGIDGDHFKNAVFFLAMAAFILFAFGPVVWAKVEATVASQTPPEPREPQPKAMPSPVARGQSRQATSGATTPPALPDTPVRVELSDEARQVVAAELAEYGPMRSEPIDTAGLARELRAHYSRGRPILTDAENAPDRAAIYKANQSFIKWGTALEETLTRQLFERMAGFVTSLERPDPPRASASVLRFNMAAVLGNTGEVGPGGHRPLRGHVKERLDRVQALIEALEAQP